MKKIILSFLVILLAGSVIFISCNKNITGRTDHAPALNPADIDANAGTWKPVLLPRPDTFAVAAPTGIATPGYIAELNEIKGTQQNLTAQQKDIIRYWSAGAVLRWNEILRGLVAKHNLPPYQMEDGTYPIPNSANPFNYPRLYPIRLTPQGLMLI